MSLSLPGLFQFFTNSNGLKMLSNQQRLRLFILAVVVAAITYGHYTVTINQSHYHDIFRRLYYLPIILGGLWFQLRGGLLTAILVSLVYAPHVALQWGAHPDAQWEQYLEILLYNVIGLLTGFLTRRESLQRLALERSTAYLEQSYRQLKDQAGQILLFEEQLLRASRLSALGELSAGLAHEIRNPLGAIRGISEIVRDPATGLEQRQEFSEMLLREVDRLNQVVTNFLQFARPSPVGKKSYCLRQVLEDLCELSAAEYRRKGIFVDLQFSELAAVPIDADQLKQVFLNIMLNAVQAMPGGGTLRVEGLTKESLAVVRFTDTGTGIAPESLQQIFNPFFTTRHTGTGLGLSISQRIIQAHGGQIAVQSQLGQGTTFEVSVPLSES